MDSTLLPDHTGATVADAPFHILSGSFRSLSLALLVFYPANRTLKHIQTIDAYGPHQYLALNTAKDVVYTTSWTNPPILSSWSLQREHGLVYAVKHLNTVPITATSSYINVPPPYDFVYSAGGPTGEVHALGPDGSLGEKVQEYLFVPKEDLEAADKTRIALRYGSHGVEFSSTGYGFIPVLGPSTIEMYHRNPTTGHLEHLAPIPSPRGPHSHDGPRHVKLHPNGKILYCVTEHNNYLDVYEINTDLAHPSVVPIQSFSILPSHLRDAPQPISDNDDPHLKSKYRGGTLMLTPSSADFPAPIALFTTTRGATIDERGWLSAFRLDKDGKVVVQQSSPTSSTDDEARKPHIGEDEGVLRFETPTSSGKANALDIRLKASNSGETGYWILLTDDDEKADLVGAVRVLEWNGWESEDGGLKVLAQWPDGVEREVAEPQEGQAFTGASHAIWLD